MPASVSGALSQWVKEVLRGVLPGNGAEDSGDGLLRKLAHFCEFSMLGTLLMWLYAMRLKRWLHAAGLSIGCAAATAVVDELIQAFSPGRNSNIWDMGLDTAGAALGIGLLWLGYIITKKIKMKDKITGGKQL